MTKRTTLALISVALLSLAPPSPAAQHEKEKTSAKAVRHEVADAAEAIRQYGADKRDEAARKAQAALDARLEALEARIDRNWDKMDQAAREQARSSLKTLREQRVEVAEWYGGLKHSTAEAWDQMKAGFSGAYTSLRRTWEKAETDNPEGGKP